MLKDNMTRPLVRQFLADSEREFSRRVEELSEGVASYEIAVSAHEYIKLRSEIRDGHILFDFTGTTPGQTIFMTDSAIMGAAIGTFLSLLNQPIPVNTGVLSRFEIKSPKGSLVNSAFPHPLYLGHTDGLNLLANAIALCLGKIDPKLSWAASGPSHCSLEVRLQGRPPLPFSLPVGIGATQTSAGIDGAYVWRRLSKQDSIELIEKSFPVQFVHVAFRANSGGPGQHPGGRGVATTVKLCEDAEIGWNFLEPPHKPEGVAGGKSAQGPEIVIHTADGRTKTALPSSGERKLRRGDMITLLSAGGGGYGAPEAAKLDT
jgi:N-methylhydantoinase B/oxoprolinase/acetone carboxylase alpha subunit